MTVQLIHFFSGSIWISEHENDFRKSVTFQQFKFRNEVCKIAFNLRSSKYHLDFLQYLIFNFNQSLLLHRLHSN